MINPQTTTLMQAYDPYLTMERLMFFDGSLENSLLDYVPSADDDTWIWAFNFDHEHTLIHVMVKNYVSLGAAREALLDLMWNHHKIFKCGGITDMMDESSYQRVSGSNHLDEWGVNSDEFYRRDDI